ncbi:MULTISPECIES: alpha/beta fold hydrolase [Variovorax]|uniref:Alpha/beta hydrolase family protein n=1 Tax=Variovorax paradoxus B4 TaxID=1246301 RepID=T1X6M1_VARPD|nr:MULTISPECIES: alpha/beta hydrolase [Variovorax]AGU47815.1 alpha/beta hydrolase family protein [Variovorax paradoxus B4]SEK13349.1 Pimeloyl-ACP methyl ester carboxylesterase [Variovorax sp. OK202]SFD86035.1 Pimeloyl-ACP methyl ester carboxylesterase [Variovorax sp. OK212]
MQKTIAGLALAAVCGLLSIQVRAEPALEVLGRDFVFSHRVEGMPARLSDFKGLQVNHFVTNDGVKLAYWEAGQGKPLILVPGWSANGAQYINVMYLLAKHYRVYVLDPRNQGLSQHVDYGNRIARYSMDLKEFGDHLGVKSADYVGHSMGAAILWSYIDLFGTGAMRKAVFVDEPISIYSHSDWSEKERSEAGGSTSSPERMVAALTAGGPVNKLITDMKPFERAQSFDSPYFANSEGFASAVIKSDPQAMGRVLFNHTVSDWRDVVRHKIDIPVAIFSGDESNNLPSQRWAQSVIPNATLYSYTSAEQGDHFLMFKNPVKFASDLQAFLAR